MTSLLEDLRANITDVQRAALTVCWRYYCNSEHNQWISIRRLHTEQGGKAVIRPRLEELGGTIIFEQEDSTTTRYHLMFLGILLTENGEWYEQLLEQYLNFLVTLSQQDPDRLNVKSQELAAALSLTEEQTVLLGILLSVESLFTNGIGGYRTVEWQAGIPSNIEDLPQDLLGYVRARVIERYDPDVPLGSMDRSAYYSRQRELEWQLKKKESIQLSLVSAEDVKKIIALKSRRLQLRREQEAIYGISADPSITMEIEQLEEEIKTLTGRLP